MTAREQAAFAAGIEVRNDAGELRQQAAVAVLQGLAEGLKATFIDATPSAGENDTAGAVAKL